ncbi:MULTISPECIES: hypothetical protein [Burkholderia]|uniref:Uncharacterized protein n=2 Tax=Burkholderia lata (strain ATCC 17760 / DSM 23089 / LMG 22485 / NCIMB 9086 / R18194 / 383) TaxID=482957 RepID=Q39P90_BURL3|nr:MULTISPECIES: hypothetical protein [Burkholderia]ABB05726.1 hypothetical protein Bcep18194_C6676 [Burkholderia lata]KAF1035292.1 MAG: hypothetical protein GAK33_04890 [Burkholderia lata]VWM18681.1 hypothetical protein BLA6992_06890 [Burkholderia lata]
MSVNDPNVPKDLEQPGNGEIRASNLTAQIHHRGVGNPVSVLPRTAISNCFPGLEFDFRNLWRRAFVGITLVENNNYVIDAEPGYEHLKTRRLLSFDGHKVGTMVLTTGPVLPGGDPVTLASKPNPNAVSFMEWSNSIARIVHLQGKPVECEFTAHDNALEEVYYDHGKTETLKVTLTLRRFFEGDTASFNLEMLKPGELTQGLCAPWQNDYRECACYYWAASRPDFVNVEPGDDGLARGDMWFAKRRTGTYVPDNRVDTRLWSYDDLFRSWQEDLQFVIRGKDADET